MNTTFATQNNTDAAQAVSVDMTTICSSALTETISVSPGEQQDRQGVVSRVVKFMVSKTAPIGAQRHTVKDVAGTIVARMVLVSLLFSMMAFGQSWWMKVQQEFQSGANYGASEGRAPSAAQIAEEAENARTETLIKKFDCERDGLGEGVFPARAIVSLPSTPMGHATVTSFEEAWDIVEGKASGAVIAFCRK